METSWRKPHPRSPHGRGGTPTGPLSGAPSGAAPREDEVKIRTTAVYTGTPIATTLSGAKAAALGIAALKKSGYAVKTLQEYL